MDQSKDPYVIIAKLLEFVGDILINLSNVNEVEYKEVDRSGNIKDIIFLPPIFVNDIKYSVFIF